jgi:hypothetical protein
MRINAKTGRSRISVAAVPVFVVWGVKMGREWVDKSQQKS